MKKDKKTVALDMKELAELMCLPVARVQLLYDSVLHKLNLEDEKEMKKLLRKLLSQKMPTLAAKNG